MIILGLTGSIGMGKSTTAQMFREAGIPVHDADACVHELYSGKAASLVEDAFPGTTDERGVNRALLAKHVVGDPGAMRRLEAIIHPLVADARNEFLDSARQSGAWLAVLDIPLLFETGGDQFCDRVVVVSAPAEIQRERVLSRPQMTAEKFEAILARQMPDSQKRSRADFVVDTSSGLEDARIQVEAILRSLREEAETDA